MVCQTVNSISNSNYKLTNCNITGVNTSNPAKPIFYFTYDQINSNGSQERGKSSYYDSYGRAVAETPEEEKTIPLETVAQKVISNAAGGDASAQQAIVAAAQDIINEAETDQTKARPIVNQLEANAETATQEEAPPLDLSLEFPKFCSWAPVVCEAAQVVLTFPNTLTEWWETANTKAEEWALSISEAWAAAKEWATSEPEEQDSNELEFEDLNIDADQVNLSGSSTCPQDSVSFSLMGKSVTLDMPYQPVCDALNFFKPAVLLVGAVASVYIVAGVRTKEEDQA
jgi:hypothetical protein